MIDETELEALVQKVQSNQKYASITPSLLKRLSEDAITRGLKGKSAVKYVRNKCHQIGGAYFRHPPEYSQIHQSLNQLPVELQSDRVRAFCLKTMGAHASTAERLPILESFFTTCLAPIAPITSILDVACGMNPLALPWIPLEPGGTYLACDIYEDLLDLIQSFFTHFQIQGKAQPCDLLSQVPTQLAQVAFILKSIPCLEQVDKQVALRLMENLPAPHILVSFPAHSLGGGKKGMPGFYREHFHQLLAEKSWQVREFSFASELAFLVTK